MDPIPPPLALDLGDAEGAAGWLQPFAGGRLWSSRALHCEARPAPLRPPESPTVEATEVWESTYDGPGLVDGGLHRIRAFTARRGAQAVLYADGERFVVEPGGGPIRREGPAPPSPRSLERSLGPPMALALAGREIHLLHASAIARLESDNLPGGVIALTARSGGGKSTLAARAGRRSEPGSYRWVRVADDQLPVKFDHRTVACPHFPQLKLGPEEQYPLALPPQLRLERLLEIEHSPAFKTIELLDLAPVEACLALTRATVAAKLFDPELLRRHLERAALAARRLPVQRLRFPSGERHLPAVLDVLAGLAP